MPVKKTVRKQKATKASDSDAKVSKKQKVSKAQVSNEDCQSVKNDTNDNQEEAVCDQCDEENFLIKVNGAFVRAKERVEYVCLDGEKSFSESEV